MATINMTPTELFAHCEKKKMFLKHIDSQGIDVKTTIGEYTNKMGKSHMAHFTLQGKYFGSVAKLGEDPIYYTGNFPIKPEYFYLRSDYKTCTFETMFIAKKNLPAGQKIILMKRA